MASKIFLGSSRTIQHLKTGCRNELPLKYISIQLLQGTRCSYIPLCRKTSLFQRKQTTQMISTQNALSQPTDFWHFLEWKEKQYFQLANFALVSWSEVLCFWKLLRVWNVSSFSMPWMSMVVFTFYFWLIITYPIGAVVLRSQAIISKRLFLSCCYFSFWDANVYI